MTQPPVSDQVRGSSSPPKRAPLELPIFPAEPKRCLATPVSGTRSAKALPLPLGLQPKTCPLRERAANQLSQSEVEEHWSGTVLYSFYVRAYMCMRVSLPWTGKGDMVHKLFSSHIAYILDNKKRFKKLIWSIFLTERQTELVLCMMFPKTNHYLLCKYIVSGDNIFFFLCVHRVRRTPNANKQIYYLNKSKGGHANVTYSTQL